jgi:hypothetical protein
MCAKKVNRTHSLPGVGPMWDLSLDSVHTFAVGDVQAVVHNCPISGGSGGSSGTPQTTEIVSRLYASAGEAFKEVIRQLGGIDDITEQTSFGRGDYEGLPNGYTSPDGERSWRLDYDEHSSKGLHFNWIDSTGGPKGGGARWGAVKTMGNAATYDSMLGDLLSEGIEGMLR